MALISCPECEHQISSYAVACPNCGFPLALTDQLISDRAHSLATDSAHANSATATATVADPAEAVVAVAPSAAGVAGVAAVAAAAAAAVAPAAAAVVPTVAAPTAALPHLSLTTGSFITMGNWGGEDIEWFALRCDSEKALILSTHGIDCRPYNELDANVDWQECSLRKWLNGEFLQGAFSPKERARILVSDEQGVTTKGHENLPATLAREKVFLLSFDQAEGLFDSAESRICTCTDYAKSRGVWLDDAGACRWWLRTPSKNDNHACLVLSDGNLFAYGSFVDNDKYAVRPALWLAL